MVKVATTIGFTISLKNGDQCNLGCNGRLNKGDMVIIRNKYSKALTLKLNYKQRASETGKLGDQHIFS